MRFDDAPRPLTIAHRAGNHLDLLHRAEELGADIIEADVWRYRGEMEVRHLKTLGRIPILWDRWKLTRGWGRRLSLAELLSAARPGTMLMLDLKGRDTALPAHVIELLDGICPGRPIVVTSQNWALLRPFRARADTRVLHSIGGTRALASIAAHLANHDDGAISIHQKLLTPEVVATLKGIAHTLVTWPVNDERRLRELASWGVDGFTIDDLGLLAKVVAERDATGA